MRISVWLWVIDDSLGVNRGRRSGGGWWWWIGLITGIDDLHYSRLVIVI